ncbi:GNAT family N-acetyltransferase [Streptomyces sp. 4N124]|uniref:GNAT family N-acetyltransferase n=1 Tax=Streptomyces sp. 4N124 TaxID=3457420 RepID=UPI003FCFCE57
MRWIGDGSLRDEQQTRSGIEEMERAWEAEGFGLFAVEVRSTGELAGFTGLAIPHFLPELLPAVDPGCGRRVRDFALSSDRYVTATP